MKRILAHLVSIAPTSKIRVFLYRCLFGYRIERARIGFRTVILVESLDLVDSSIAHRCIFAGPMRVEITRATVGAKNIFLCGAWTREPRFAAALFGRKLCLSPRSMITSGHYFDVAGEFILGEGSWIAGIGSQFWTHGAGEVDRNISIGSDCYIGSAVRFAPGSGVGNSCIVGLGSVVTKKYEVDNAMIAGVPARVVKEHYDWKSGKPAGGPAAAESPES